MAMSEENMPKRTAKTGAIATAVVIVVLGLMALDTTVVKIGSEKDFRQQAFSPDAYGRSEFPRIREMVKMRAADAIELSVALSTDKKAAIAEYATMAGAFPVFPVKFEGIVGSGKSGVFEISINGFPEGVKVRVQSGPAINGTELRDIPGDIEFGAFKNQIEYQNAGAGINRAMNAALLSELDRDGLPEKTVSVVGVFKLINPKNWLVTPVEFDVK